MIRDVESAPDSITRRIVLETVDRTGKRLDYEQVADVIFNRETQAIQTTLLPGAFTLAPHSWNATERLIDDILSGFDTWRGMLNHEAIRTWIRRTVLHYGATPLKSSGGVYFLMEEQAEHIDILEQFVRNLPGGNEFITLPLPDDKKRRDIVKRSLEADTNDAIDHLLTQLRVWKRDGTKTRKGTYAQLLAEKKRLREHTKKYAVLLETELGEIESRLTLLDRAVNDFGRHRNLSE